MEAVTLLEAALDLIRQADINRTLAWVGRITTADQIALAEALCRYEQTRRRVTR